MNYWLNMRKFRNELPMIVAYVQDVIVEQGYCRINGVEVRAIEIRDGELFVTVADDAEASNS